MVRDDRGHNERPFDALSWVMKSGACVFACSWLRIFKFIVLCVATPCVFVDLYRRFGRKCYRQLQSRRWFCLSSFWSDYGLKVFRLSPSYPRAIHFNIINPPAPVCYKWSLYLNILYQNRLYIYLLTHTYYMPCPSNPRWFGHFKFTLCSSLGLMFLRCDVGCAVCDFSVKCNAFAFRGFLLGLLVPRRCRHYFSSPPQYHLYESVETRTINHS